MPFKDPAKKKEYDKKYRAEYYLKNKEKIKQLSKEQRREYYSRNRERIKALRRKRYAEKLKNNKRFVINNRTSTLIRKVLKSGKQGRRWEDLVPYTLDDLIRRLKETIPKGYTWEDIGNLHIDHIIPRTVFNFEKPEDEDFQRCWALSNLRLLPSSENQSKGNKLEKPFQPRLVFH